MHFISQDAKSFNKGPTPIAGSSFPHSTSSRFVSAETDPSIGANPFKARASRARLVVGSPAPVKISARCRNAAAETRGGPCGLSATRVARYGYLGARMPSRLIWGPVFLYAGAATAFCIRPLRGACWASKVGCLIEGNALVPTSIRGTGAWVLIFGMRKAVLGPRASWLLRPELLGRQTSSSRSIGRNTAIVSLSGKGRSHDRP